MTPAAHRDTLDLRVVALGGGHGLSASLAALSIVLLLRERYAWISYLVSPASWSRANSPSSTKDGKR